jgi:Flp pilus assembly protein TadG
MMARIVSRLSADLRGSPTVDFAMTFPIIVLTTVGVLQLGIAFLANAGLRAGVEASARFATVYPYPTNKDDIVTKFRNSVFGMPTLAAPTSTTSGSCKTYTGAISGRTDSYTSTICTGNSNGSNYIDVTGTYPISLNFVFISTPAFNLSYTRRAWQL